MGLGTWNIVYDRGHIQCLWIEGTNNVHTLNPITWTPFIHHCMIGHLSLFCRFISLIFQKCASLPWLINMLKFVFHLYFLEKKNTIFVLPELSSVRDYVITHSVRSMYVCVCMCMYVVFCKIDHYIHIHWCIVMGLGHNDPWVESQMWPQQTWGQRSSRGQWPLVQVFGKKGQCILILWCIFKSNITMIAKVCDRESRRDTWFENRLVNNVFLFSFFSFLFILIVWVKVAGGTAHSLQHGWSGLQVWVTFPLPTCALVVRGGEAAGHGSIALSICLPLRCDCGVWVGGGGCSHSPRGPAYYLCLGLG